MEDISKTFTIQWVGPFSPSSPQVLKDYLNDPNTCDKHLFSFYYCSGSKKGKGYPIDKMDYRYFGLHKANTPITARVNATHETLSKFREYKLWLGTFSDSSHQTADNIEEVETLFISTYASQLSENVKKTKSSPADSICIINLWYKLDETRWKIKKDEMKIFDDVLIYEKESDTYSVGSLKLVR